jgi:uncharacterized membrane protein YhaH (DUF805 family)
LWKGKIAMAHPPQLSNREWEVIQFLLEGKSNKSNLVSSLREAVSKIGMELKIKIALDTNTRDDTNPITFSESIRICLTKYAEFNGRASRAEFWWFALFVLLVALALAYLNEILSSVFLIAILLPFLAAGTRRLRDKRLSPTRTTQMITGLRKVSSLRSEAICTSSALPILVSSAFVHVVIEHLLVRAYSSPATAGMISLAKVSSGLMVYTSGILKMAWVKPIAESSLIRLMTLAAVSSPES